MATPTTASTHTRTLFFYGTLMAPAVLSRVLSRPASTLSLHPAVLPLHRRHRVRGADYPAVVPCASASVLGTVVAGLTEREVWRLDVFEGGEYARRRVEVRVLAAPQTGGAVEAGDGQETPWEAGGEEVVEAETYVWTAGREELEEGEWDFEEFVREKLAVWAGEDEGRRDAGFGDVERAVKLAEAEAEAEGGGDPTGGRSFRAGKFEEEVGRREGEGG